MKINGTFLARADRNYELRFYQFADVAKACDRWLEKRGLKIGGFKDVMDAEAKEGKRRKAARN